MVDDEASDLGEWQTMLGSSRDFQHFILKGEN